MGESGVGCGREGEGREVDLVVRFGVAGVCVEGGGEGEERGRGHVRIWHRHHDYTTWQLLTLAPTMPRMCLHPCGLRPLSKVILQQRWQLLVDVECWTVFFNRQHGGHDCEHVPFLILNKEVSWQKVKKRKLDIDHSGRAGLRD